MPVLALTPKPSAAHELHHVVTREPAVVIDLRYADGTPFNYEEYQIFAGEETVPFQVGRTDAEGRITFLPDRSGSWRLRSFAEDGHGLDVSFETGPSGEATARPSGWFDRYPRLFSGLGLILGIFGILSLMTRRRSG